MTDGQAIDCSDHPRYADDVNVNAVDPGQPSTTRFTTRLAARAEAGAADQLHQRIVDRQGVRRLGTPEDVAVADAFRCRPEARHVQGVAIGVDGGSISRSF